MSRGLTAQQHRELGAVLKEARRLLLEAGAPTRCYRGVSQELFEIADSLMSPRAFLEKRLIELVGDDAQVEGVHVRDCYFGEFAQEEVENA
jgi:hypothetical protein